VLIVDDMPFYGSHLSTLLRPAGYDPVTARSGEEALALVQQAPTRFRLALVDILLPGAAIEGVEAARRLTGQYSIPCIMLTAVADDSVRMACYLSGALGYLVKDASLTDQALLDAVAAGMRGVSSAPPVVDLHRAVQQYQREAFIDSRLRTLTAAQRRVATGLRDGLTNQEIAARLGISVSTVNTHVQEILTRLGLSSRRDLLPHRIYDSFVQEERDL
jgi:DNA-binding NarL/FixJ family response regulator